MGFLEEALVAREQVMFVKVGAEPGTRHHIIGPRRAAGLVSDRIGCTPDIAVVMDCPALHVVHVPYHFSAGYRAVLDECHQRKCAGAESERLGRPVIHLDVDVGVEVGSPGGMTVLAPYSLKV